MARLCERTCEPCRIGAPPLGGEKLAELHAQVPDWDVVEAHHLSRTWKLPDFVSALAMVNRVGDLAEEQGHHPDIYLTWGRVRIEVHTHKIDGLTESDFVLAAKIDQLG